MNASEMNSTTPTTNDNKDSDAIKVVCYVMIVLGFCGVLGNILVCVVILRVKFLHNITNYLLVNLAVADTVSCIAACLHYLVANKRCVIIHFVPQSTLGKDLYCRILVSTIFVWSCCFCTGYSLCLVTLEKYIGIVQPLQYPRKLTKKRIKVLLALVWVGSIVISLPFLFTIGASPNPNQACRDISYYHPLLQIVHSLVLFLTHYLIPIVFMCWAYFKIQATLSKQAEYLKQQHVKQAALSLLVARQRLVSLLKMVLGALIVLWTPAYLLDLICPNIELEFNLVPFCSSDTAQLVFEITNCLFYLNSVINPVIYEFKYKKFRQGLKEVLGCRVKRKENQVTVQMTGKM